MASFDAVDLSLNATVSEDGSQITCTWNYGDVSLNFIKTPAVVVDLGNNSSGTSYPVSPSSSTSFVLTDISYGAVHDIYVTYYNTNTKRAYMSQKKQVTHGYAPTALTSSTVEIIPGNTRISLKLNGYSRESAYDGYSPLKSVTVKVMSSTGPDQYFSFSDASFNLYTDFLPISGLTNDVTYDLDILVSNVFGNGGPYGVHSITPTNNIVGVQNLIAVENIALNPSVTGIAVLFNPPAYDAEIVTSYTIVTCDASGNQHGSPIVYNTDASKNPIDLTIYDGSGNVIRTSYNGSLYKYKYPDANVLNSQIRQYKVYVTNPAGTSVLSATSFVTGCSVPGAPTIVVTPVVSESPGQGSIKVNITDNLLNGLPMLKHLVKVWMTSDASQNAVGGYNYSEVTGMDGSGNVTLTHANILNGVNYAVAVKTVTQGTIPNTYTSAAATSSVVPYARPATPVAPTVSALDASGNPLDSKLNISWVAPAAYTALAQYGVDSSLNYALYTADASGAYTVLVYDGPNRSYQQTGLTNGRTYGYVLKTYVMNGADKVFSGASSPVKEAQPFAAPGQVASFTPTANGSNSISYRFTGLQVTDASHNIRYQLDVYCSDASSVVVYTSDVIADVSNSVTYAQINNKLGFEHTLKITAYVVDSQVSPNRKYFGSSRDATVIPYIVPGEPQSLDVVPSNGSFSCTWLAVPGLDVSSNVGGVHITGYSVQLLNGAGATLGSQTTSSNLFYSQTGLTNGTVYGVKVTPVGCIGNNISDGTLLYFDNYAVNYSFTPQNNAPATPVFLKYSPNDGAVELKWLEPKSFSLGTWNIYQNDVHLPQLSLTPQFRPAIQSDTTGNFGSYNLWYLTISGLTNGQRYKFTVMAENNSGIGSPVAEIYAVPQKPPGSPTNSSYAVTNDSLTLTWDAPTVDGGASKLGGLQYRVNVYDTTDMSGGFPLAIQNTGKPLISSDLVSGINPYNTPNPSTNSTITKTFNSSGYSGIIGGHTYAAEIYAFYTVDVSFVDINNATQYDSFTSISDAPLIRRGMLVTAPAPEVINPVTAVAGDKTVTLSWVDPSQNIYILSDHKIYRQINGVGNFSLLTTVPQSAGVNLAFSYTDTTVLNGISYKYKVVLTNTSTADPTGVESNSVTPSGKPIFATQNITTTDSGNFLVSICKNGSTLTDFVAVGLVSDASGDIIPVATGTPDFTSNSLTTFNGQPIAAGQAGTFSFTMSDTNNNGNDITNIVNVSDMLLIVSNEKGTRSAFWPTNSVFNRA